MIKIFKKYENGFERTFTVKSARFVNAENDSAVIETEESGSVVISKNDEPELWSQAVDGGVTFKPFQQPETE